MLRKSVLTGLVILVLLSACAKPRAEENTPTAESRRATSPSATVVSVTSATPAGSEMPAATPRETVLPSGSAETVIRERDGMEMARIPAGKTWIGCASENNAGFDCNPDELPLHQVSLAEFWMDRHEVSNAQYALCVADGVCEAPFYQRSATRDDYYGNPDFADYPRVAVSWHEAAIYCEWAGGRLPTEAEWVRAARGRDKRVYPWGNEPPSCERANSLDENNGRHCAGDTLPVESFPQGASPFGVLNLAGNVWEWTADWYHQDYYSVSPTENPQGPERGGTKVVHGGGFDYSWERMRVAYTSDHDPREHKISFGFRCVMDPSELNLDGN